jgi:carbonic anhydrase
MDADRALQRLREGNRRFVSDRSEHAHRDLARREELASGQKPWAMVLGCADSRVSPEIVFDVGLGELFVVRVAGNLATPTVVASLELAAGELGCPLLVVLGHTGCGAVTTALEGASDPPGTVGHLCREIAPSVAEAASRHGSATVDTVVRCNVQRQVESLRRGSPVLGRHASDGHLVIAGAVYDLGNGKVSFLEPSPSSP